MKRMTNTCILLLSIFFLTSCKNNSPNMERKEISDNESIHLQNFIPPPPPDSASNSIKTFNEWIEIEANFISPDSLYTFRLFKTSNKRYAIYLVSSIPSVNNIHETIDVARVGGYHIFTEKEYNKELTWDDVLNKVQSEFANFLKQNQIHGTKFMKARSINLTYDNYNMVKLFPK